MIPNGLIVFPEGDLISKIAYACVDITNCLEDAWLRLRFAEIVSQIITSDNAIGGLNPSRPIPFSV
jgi:hypothetical protein